MLFFLQAEDGIRDAQYGLEFRRVLFRSGSSASAPCCATPGATPNSFAIDSMPPACCNMSVRFMDFLRLGRGSKCADRHWYSSARAGGEPFILLSSAGANLQRCGLLRPRPSRKPPTRVASAKNRKG